jgi:hypothetical protein
MISIMDNKINYISAYTNALIEANHTLCKVHEAIGIRQNAQSDIQAKFEQWQLMVKVGCNTDEIDTVGAEIDRLVVSLQVLKDNEDRAQKVYNDAQDRVIFAANNLPHECM